MLKHVRFSDELAAVGWDFFASLVLKSSHLLTPFLEPKDLLEEKKPWLNKNKKSLGKDTTVFHMNDHFSFQRYMVILVMKIG